MKTYAEKEVHGSWTVHMTIPKITRAQQQEIGDIPGVKNAFTISNYEVEIYVAKLFDEMDVISKVRDYLDALGED